MLTPEANPPGGEPVATSLPFRGPTPHPLPVTRFPALGEEPGCLSPVTTCGSGFRVLRTSVPSFCLTPWDARGCCVIFTFHPVTSLRVLPTQASAPNSVPAPARPLQGIPEGCSHTLLVHGGKRYLGRKGNGFCDGQLHAMREEVAQGGAMARPP